MLLINLFAFIASCLVLVKSGGALVKSLTSVSKYLRLSEFVTGFVIIGVSTSIPELFIGVTSALAKANTLSLGNVIGANIIDLTLVIGIGVLLSKGIKVSSNIVKKDVWLMVMVSAVPLILMIDQRLSRVDGFILLFIFFLYLFNMFSQRREFHKILVNGVSRKEFVKDSLLFVMSLMLLFISAQFIVKYASLLSIELALPQIIIGLFLISICTTLPELAFEAKAVLLHREELALGNVVGSVIANSTLVLGITSIIYPIANGFLIFFTSAAFMLLVAFIFMTFVESGSKLTRKEGASLIFLYIFFIIVEFYVKGLGR